MNDMDRLRNMLDERGVDWYGGYMGDDRATYYTSNLINWTVVDVPDIDGLMHVDGESYATLPEFVIDATTQRTCRIEAVPGDGMHPDGERCSACGEFVMTTLPRMPRYCPSCGARVVG